MPRADHATMGEPGSGRQWAQWIMTAAGVAMIAAAVWIVAGHHAPAPSAAAAPARPAAERVSLYVQHDGPALRLHWNADSDAIRRAGSGALVINDGPRHSRLDLTQEDLRTGAASYWPETPGVNFKLELDGAVAGELPALAVRKEEAEPRPSPFDAEAPKPKAAARRPLLQDADDDMPKPHTVRAADAVPRQEADRDAKADLEDMEPKKLSKWRRVTGKIPLLRRLGRH